VGWLVARAPRIPPTPSPTCCCCCCCCCLDRCCHSHLTPLTLLHQSKRIVVMDLRNDYEWDAGECLSE
jgi:hypothetical protein